MMRIVYSSSSDKIELIYADHSNRLKALANSARKEALLLKVHHFAVSKESVPKEVALLKLNLVS